mgnify:CR=1 FL=1
MGWIYVFPKFVWAQKLCGLYSAGFLPGKFSTLQLLRIREVKGRLCIGEVGVDLELYVHAHGHDVHPIMEASCYNNNPLVISSSSIYVWSFATVVRTMIVLLLCDFLDKWKYLSFVDHFTRPTSVLLYPRVLPSGISRISRNYITSYEFFINYYPRRFKYSTGSELLGKNTDIRFNSPLRCLNFSCNLTYPSRVNSLLM